MVSTVVQWVGAKKPPEGGLLVFVWRYLRSISSKSLRIARMDFVLLQRDHAGRVAHDLDFADLAIQHDRAKPIFPPECRGHSPRA